MAYFGPVQVMLKGSVSAASVTTTAVTTTSGNLLVAVVTCFGNHIGATPVSDSKGNTWVQALASVGTTNGFAAMYYVANATGGAGHTFTFTPTANDFNAITVFEISGAALSSVLGSTASAVTGTTPHTAGPITSNASVPEIFIAGTSVSAGSTGTVSVTDPQLWFTATIQSPASTEGMTTGFRIVGPSVTDSASFVGPGRNEGTVLAGFKAAATGGGGATGGSFTFFGA